MTARHPTAITAASANVQAVQNCRLPPRLRVRTTWISQDGPLRCLHPVVVRCSRDIACPSALTPQQVPAVGRSRERLSRSAADHHCQPGGGHSADADTALGGSTGSLGTVHQSSANDYLCQPGCGHTDNLEAEGDRTENLLPPPDYMSVHSAAPLPAA